MTIFPKRQPPPAYTHWKKGQSGNPAGRPLGSRQKLGERFLTDLHTDFQKYGVEVIERVREKYPDTYLKIVAQIVPSELNIRITDDLTDADLDQRIQQLADLLRLEVRVARIADREEAPVRQEQVIDLQALPEAEGIPLIGGDQEGEALDGGEPGGEVLVRGGGSSDPPNW